MRKRKYAIEIEFDDDVTLAEQDRQACVILERLVNDYWGDAAACIHQEGGETLSHIVVEPAIAHPVD